LDDRFDFLASFVYRLQQNQNVSGVAGGADIAFPDGGEHAHHIRVFANDIDDLFLVPRHFRERDSFGSLGVADYLTGVIGGDEAFGNDVEKPDGDQKQYCANKHREGAMLESELQSQAVTANQRVICTLSCLPEFSVNAFTCAQGGLLSD